MSRICRKAFLCVLLVALSLALAGISPSAVQETKGDKTQPADTARSRKGRTKSASQPARGQETKSQLTAAVPDQEKDKEKNKEQKAKEPGAAEAKSSAQGGKATGTATSSTAASRPAQTPPAKGMVWVNLDSGIYHKEGSRWYGQTKSGKFMTEADAKKAGYKPSKRS